MIYVQGMLPVMLHDHHQDLAGLLAWVQCDCMLAFLAPLDQLTEQSLLTILCRGKSAVFDVTSKLAYTHDTQQEPAGQTHGCRHVNIVIENCVKTVLSSILINSLCTSGVRCVVLQCKHSTQFNS